jgi:hypothetical protein
VIVSSNGSRMQSGGSARRAGAFNFNEISMGNIVDATVNRDGLRAFQKGGGNKEQQKRDQQR